MSSTSSPSSDDTPLSKQFAEVLSVKETSAASVLLPRTPPKNNRVDHLKPDMLETPHSFNSSSSKVTPHTKRALDGPLVRELDDLSIWVSHTEWIEAVCDVAPKTLLDWTMYMKAKDYFRDKQIAAAFKNFCAAKNEPSRYRPLNIIVNRVLSLVQGLEPGAERMPNLPSDGPPVSDITFFRHDPLYLATLPEQGNIAAKRRPDILATRKLEASTPKDPIAVEWSSLLLYVELKREKKLTQKLQTRLQDLQDRDEEDLSQYEYEDEEDSEVVFAEPHAPDWPVPPTSELGSEIRTSSGGPQGQKRARDDDEDESPQPSKKAYSALHPDLRPKPLEIKSERAQMAGYALELAGSTRGTRLHSIGVFATDDFFSLWYLDASGAVRTKEKTLSIIDEFEKVMAIFVALAFCKPEQLGAYHPSIIRPPEPGYPAVFPMQSLAGFTIDITSRNAPPNEPRTIATLGDHIFTQYVLFGRRTTVYKASLPNDSKVYAIKISQQYIGRKSEVDLVAHARAMEVEHIPNIIKACDVWKLSDGIRKHAAFQDHTYDDRIMRCILLTCYTPLCEKLCEDPDSIKEMVNQMLQCIHDLRYEAHILHRDISDGNIMYTKRGGKDWFVLNDFDLAVTIDANGQPEGASARHRTGTLPFMAFELLLSMHTAAHKAAEDKKVRAKTSTEDKNARAQDSVLHCVRFDYQSLWWVTLWCATKILAKGTRNKAQEEARRCQTHLAAWETGELGIIARFKRDILTDIDYTASMPLSPLFEHLRPWFEAFQEPFKRGRQAQTKWKEVKLHKSKLAARAGRTAEATNIRNSPPTHEMAETWHGALTLKNFEKSFGELDGGSLEGFEDDLEVSISGEPDNDA